MASKVRTTLSVMQGWPHLDRLSYLFINVDQHSLDLHLVIFYVLLSLYSSRYFIQMLMLINLISATFVSKNELENEILFSVIKISFLVSSLKVI